jgi:MerR family mercuric resistance operon transcriptional regulator
LHGDVTPAAVTYSIGELASVAGVGVETIRFYERRGILPEPPRTPSGYRVYADIDRWRLDFIRRGKHLGFTLGEIGALLGAGEHRSVDEVRRVAEHRLAQVEDELADLARRRDQLRNLVQTCAVGPGEQCLDLGAPCPPTA